MVSNNEQKVSVALCAYNGERFLQEQLDSIAAQTILPFEMVVCDDNSSDATQRILKDFAFTAAFPVRLYFNTENLGYVKNFEKAISLCSGDIIALCDQDDKWRMDKIEVMQRYFADPNVGMAFSNAAIIDESGQHTGQQLWDEVNFTPVLQQTFRQGDAYKVLYIRTLISGCTMAFRRKWWPFVHPIPSDILFVHDAWISLTVSLLADTVIIDDSLVSYRIHTDQSISVGREKRSALEKLKTMRNGTKSQHYNKHLNQFIAIREYIFQNEKYIIPEKRIYLLQQMKGHESHLIMRRNIPRNRLLRFGSIFKELVSGRYHLYSNGFKSALVDLLRNPV
jgi:glycosyltransferase involved in cell wall biosynthesis